MLFELVGCFCSTPPPMIHGGIASQLRLCWLGQLMIFSILILYRGRALKGFHLLKRLWKNMSVTTWELQQIYEGALVTMGPIVPRHVVFLGILVQGQNCLCLWFAAFDSHDSALGLLYLCAWCCRWVWVGTWRSRLQWQPAYSATKIEGGPKVLAAFIK